MKRWRGSWDDSAVESSESGASTSVTTTLGVAAVLALIFVVALPSCSRPKNAFEESGLKLVLLVSLDTLRPDHLSLYGYERETSPFLDELALESTVFRNAYSHVPFTLMSHASMLSSLLPDAHGVKEDRALSPNVPLMAEVLAEEGFDTYGFYGSDWLDPRFGFARGFDHWEFNYLGKDTHIEALDVIDDIANNGTKSLLFLHFHDVHCGPLNEPGVPLYPSHPDFWDRFLPYPEVDTSQYLAGDIYYDRVKLNEQEKANIVGQYDGGILYVDTILRDLTDRLKERGLYDDALIIVTSDHGESLGDRDTFDAHGLFWEEGLRVPLVVKLPMKTSDREKWVGADVKERVQTIDIAPTILRIADVEVPETFQGNDLFDGVEQEVISSRANAAVIYTGDYKLAVYRKPARRQTKLFDLRQDPGEISPIRGRKEFVEELADRLEENRRKNTEFCLSFGEPSAIEMEEDMKARLRALGYLNDD